MYLLVLPCFPNLLRLRSQIWKRVTFALFVRISAMQIIGSGQIVTFVTSVVPTFFCCIALFIFSFCFSFYYFACSVRMRWGVSPLRRRPRALPFGFPQAFEKAWPKLLYGVRSMLRKASRLDRNFKCFGAVTFAWFIELCAVLAARLLSLKFALNLGASK